MIKFKNLVFNLLEEMDDFHLILEATPPKDVVIFNKHFKGTRYNDIKTLLTTPSTGYGTTLQFPAEAEFATYIKIIATKNIRGGVKPKDFPNLSEWFPVYDLLCLFSVNYDNATWDASSTGSSSSPSDPFYTSWETHFKASHGSTPLEYVPITPEGRIMKAAFAETVNLGQLRVETIGDNHSFFASASYLLNMRRQTSAQTWPKAITKLFDTDGKKVIQHMMFNPRELITGTYEVDKKLETIFDFGITRSLVGISLGFYKVFTKEITTVLDQFINGVDPRTVKTPASGSTAAVFWYDYLTANKQDAANKLLADQELYNLYIGNVSKTEADAFDYLPYILKAYSLPNPVGIFTLAYPFPSTPYFKEDKDPTNTKEFIYEYNFANLKAAANGDYTEAKELYGDFIELGNYIKEKAKKDILGGATQVLKGLSLGVKNMGT